MFTHPIDLTCVYSWIEYKKEAASLGIAQKISVSCSCSCAYSISDLLQYNNYTKREKPSACQEEPIVANNKRANIEGQSPKEVRLYNIDRLEKNR